MKAAEAHIGKGIYSTSDLAKIFRLKDTRKVAYLFNKYIADLFEESANYRFYFGENRKLVNFDTLIHLYIFFELKKRGISYSKIFESFQVLSKKYNTPYPFSKIKISTTAGRIFANHEEVYFSADKKLQGYFKEILEPLVKRIEYENNSISKFYPLGKGKSIVVNPEIQLGSPIIEGTRINASIIFDLHKAGDSVELLSKIYDITKEQVEDAIEFANAA